MCAGREAGWSLRLPLTTAPRYVRADEEGERQAQGQPLALLRDPGHTFSLDLAFSAAESVTSPTHKLSLVREGEVLRAGLEAGEVVPDRDRVLTWMPPQEEARPALRVFRAQPGAGDWRHFLALVAPPRTVAATMAREAILLVDHSGSMERAKWQAAD